MKKVRHCRALLT